MMLQNSNIQGDSIVPFSSKLGSINHTITPGPNVVQMCMLQENLLKRWHISISLIHSLLPYSIFHIYGPFAHESHSNRLKAAWRI